MNQFEDLRKAAQTASQAQSDLEQSVKANIDLAYISGFFDGEGCISTGRHKPTNDREGGQCYIRIKISVSQKFPNILYYIQDYFGFGKVYSVKEGSQWRYSCSGSQQTITFLRALLPYLIVKKKQAELGIKLAENIQEFMSESKCRSGISDSNRNIREKLALEINHLKGGDYE